MKEKRNLEEDNEILLKTIDSLNTLKSAEKASVNDEYGGARRNKYFCGNCNFTGSSNAELISHMQSHKEANDIGIVPFDNKNYEKEKD